MQIFLNNLRDDHYSKKIDIRQYSSSDLRVISKKIFFLELKANSLKIPLYHKILIMWSKTY